MAEMVALCYRRDGLSVAWDGVQLLGNSKMLNGDRVR